MENFTWQIIGVISGITLSTIFLMLGKTLIDKIKAGFEEKEVNDDIEKRISNIASLKKEDKIDDILTLMIKNVGELREYYIINKQQARNSFSAALLISILGFVLFAAGVILTYIPNTQNVIPYSTIGGAVVELIAGLFFWIFNKATEQINLFYNSLLNTEKFLTAIQLVEKVSIEHRNKVYISIIEKVIESSSKDIKEEIKKKGTKTTLE